MSCGVVNISPSRVRAATLNDAAEIARLLQARARHDGETDLFISPGTVLRDLCGPDAWIEAAVAVRASGELAGVAAWHRAYEAVYAARGAYVAELYVDPDQRRHGLGSALLAHAARATRDAGGAYLWLMSRKTNTSAHAFYRRIADIEDDGGVAFAIAREAFQRLCDGSEPLAT